MIAVNQGRSTPFSGKKIFALIAVALMVASCFAAVTAVDESKAAGTQTVITDESIVIDGGGSTCQIPKVFTKDQVDFDTQSKTLTINNLDVKHSWTKGSEGYQPFITIQNNQSNSNVDGVKIVVKGENKIASENTQSVVGCIYSNVPLTIEGKDGGSLDLSIGSKVTNLYGIEVESSTLTIKDLDLKITIDSAIAACSGIRSHLDLSIDNSTVVISCPDTTLEAGKSQGIHIDEFSSKFSVTNSTVTTSAYDNAMISGNGGVPTKDISNSTILASEEPSGANPVEVMDDTISKDYKWVKIEPNAPVAHTLHFDPNGGTGVPADKQLFKDDKYDLSQAKPTRDGYVLSGWKDSDGKSYAITDTFIMPDKDMILAAQWEVAPVVEKHKVVFDLNGGKGDGFGPQEIQKGTTFKLPSISPTRDGHTFKSWKDANGTEYKPGATFTMPDKDVTLTAQWEKISAPAEKDYTWLLVAIIAVMVIEILALVALIYYTVLKKR